MSDQSPSLASLAREQETYATAMRRTLHRIPELAFAEHKTAAVIAGALREMGYAPVTGLAGTGITARLDFGGQGPTLMLRADMDALPVAEETGFAFASEHEGRMHACGHDGHMAMLLGTAKALKTLRDSPAAAELSGSVLFVFQPAEESMGGARPMVDEGLLEDVDQCLAMHIWPDLPEGCVGLKDGPLMAAMDRFEVHITATGGHGAQPHLCTDALDAAARLARALNQVCRRVDPLKPAVLTLGCIQAGDTYNVIPSKALLKGSARCFDEDVRKTWEERINAEAEAVCLATGTSCELRFLRGHGAVVNDPAVTEAARRAAERAVGAQRVVPAVMTLTGEDFSVYQERVPGCMMFLGSGAEGGMPLHNPGFCFNEAILADGVRVFCEYVAEYLAKE